MIRTLYNTGQKVLDIVQAKMCIQMGLWNVL